MNRAVVLLGCLVAGCTSAGPVAQNYPMAGQEVMNSASHWQILASRTADEVKAALQPGQTAVNLEPAEDSDFARAFNGMLATELTHRGVLVGPNSALMAARVDVAVVRHRSQAPLEPWTYSLLGTMAGLSVFLAESQPLAITAAAAAPLGLAGGALIDANRNFFPSATDTEIVVTTGLYQGGVQTGGRSEVFYVHRINAGEYDPGGSARTVRVVGDLE
jgi:hypothetical protein